MRKWLSALIMNVGLMSFQYIVFTPTEEQSWWRHSLRSASKNDAGIAVGLYLFVLRPTFHLVYFYT